MKHLLLAVAVLTVVPTAAFGAVYIEYEGVPGESVATPKVSPAATSAAATVAPARSVATPTPTPAEASTDYLIKLPGVDGETEDPTPTPKPQEGNTNPGGTEDINIGVGEQQSNFGVLLGGSSEESEEAEAVRAEVAEVLLEGMSEGDRPVETLSLNYGKIKATVRQPVKLFGFIPVDAEATVEIDADDQVKVKFPWWGFLTSGKNSDEVGEDVFTRLLNSLKTRHDTVKNSIGNIR